jgi:hypothetical protein
MFGALRNKGPSLTTKWQEGRLTNGNFDARVKAARLKPQADELPQLEALVLDLDRAAAALRGPMPYALEPLAALHLTQAQDD